MSSFLGNLLTKQRSSRLEMMTQVAAICFDRQPCVCEGCQKFLADMLSYGKPPESR